MFAYDLHIILAQASIVAIGTVVAEGAWRALADRRPGRLSAALSVVAMILVGMAAAGGLAILVLGERPTAILHYVYAVLGFGLIPLADSLTGRASPRRMGLGRLFAGLLALGVIARLFGTG